MSPPSFTPAVAAALAGPAWLHDRRSAAAETFAASTLPSSEEEVWRYSRIGSLDLDLFAPAPESANTAASNGVTALAVVAEPAARVVLSNGHIIAMTIDPALAALGVYVGPLAGAPDAPTLLGSAMDVPLDVFVTMNDAFAREPLAIVVPRGVSVDRPILIEHHVDGDGVAVFPRLAVRADDNAAVRVLEVFRSTEHRALVVPVVELVASPGAQVGYLGVQQLGAASWQLGTVIGRADTAATVHASAAGLVGHYARVRTDCRLAGRGATGTLSSVYFGTGQQMLDFRTFQDHAAPDTSSSLLFKGAVDDASASVYTGLIRVRKNARGTNALQTNRNIKLSDDAWAESVPNLEIENNDVHCKHESAVSPIDADQRFYLQSRGVPPLVADRLVVSGFFREVLDRLAVPEAHGALASAIAGKLHAGDTQ